MKLTNEQKQEIEKECLDNLLEDMSFPVAERLDLSELAEIYVQGLMTCKVGTTLTPCTEELQNVAERYLIDLYGKHA